MEFIDKKNRNIKIYVDDFKILAEHNEVNVGEFSYNEIDNGSDYGFDLVYELDSMHVIDEYQNAGIGSEMLRLGEETFEKIIYPEDGTENYPTKEGAKLLNSAIRNGIIIIPNIDDDIDITDYDMSDDEEIFVKEEIVVSEEKTGTEYKAKNDDSNIDDLFINKTTLFKGTLDDFTK